MKIISNTLTTDNIARVASDLGFEAYGLTSEGTRKRGKWAGKTVFNTLLRPGPNMIKGSDLDYRYRATQIYSGRRIWAINWEGHRDFMLGIFELDPNATIDSSLARYNGVDEFERLHTLTGSDMNRGYRPKVSAS